MCGRFTLISPGETVARMFGGVKAVEFSPRYNIAPTQPVIAVRSSPAGGGREMTFLRWGLVPGWAKDPAIGDRLINARSETAAGKPAFRAAFRYRRCLVPADGFYEWRRLGQRKQPYFIRMRDLRPFAIAGLWERREGSDGSVLETCALLTTDANDLLAPIHDRMPVILPASACDIWLDSSVVKAERLGPLLAPYPAGEMEAYPVGTQVNNPGFDDPRCVAPLD